MSLIMLSECSTPEFYPWDPCASLKFSKDMPLIMDLIKLEFPIIIDKSVKEHEVLPDLWCWWWARMSEAVLPGPPKFRASSLDSIEACSPRSEEICLDEGPTRGRNSFWVPRPQRPAFPRPMVETRVIEINTDPDCCKTTDPDMASAKAQAWISWWLWVAAQATMISLASVAAWASDTKVALDDGIHPRQPHGLHW